MSETRERNKSHQIILTSPAIFLITAAGFEFNPLTNVTINCFSMDSFLSFSASTRMTSALKPSSPKA